jgi:hypothetical protein
MISYLKKRACFFRLFLFFSFTCFISVGQGINNLWLFGYANYAGAPWGTYNLDFNNPPFTIDTVSRSIDEYVTNANIADSSGNLLFYTNGVTVADANGDTMQNGDGLNPSWYNTQYPEGLNINQANLILPLPNSSNIFYLFHSTIDYPVQSTALHLYLSIIDMNIGLGAVISKNQSIINDTLNTGKITAVRHGNGRDWWVICHRAFSDMYYKFLLTPTGLSGPFTQNIGSNRSYDVGQVCFSPDGSKFAYFSIITEMDVLDFDRCSGTFSNFTHIAINDSAFGRGVAFSPNSQFLYAPSTNYVYQFDVTAANIAATQTTVGVWDSSMYSPPQGGPLLSLPALFNIAQLAPDGKIYISTGNSTFVLHEIDQPDSAGLACNFIPMGVQLPFYYFNSLPNHPNYFLGRLVGSVCDSLTGIAEVENDFHFSLFPNPNNGKFSISYLLPQNKDGTLEIFDLTGSIIYKQNLPMWSTLQHILIPNLADGVYLIKIISGNNSISKKLIVLKT